MYKEMEKNAGCRFHRWLRYHALPIPNRRFPLLVVLLPLGKGKQMFIANTNRYLLLLKESKR